jgi:hypothetical protein
MSFHCPDRGRIMTGRFASRDGDNFGAFFIASPDRRERAPLKIIASDGRDDSGEIDIACLPHRCPTWEEMCHVKGIFWAAEDAVMQLHPPASENISNHSYCLHLWRPTQQAIPMPPAWTVGDKSLGTLV